MPEQRTQVAFKDKRKHITGVNIPNMTYKDQHMILKYHMVQEIMLLCHIQ